jgi:K+ transporter
MEYPTFSAEYAVAALAGSVISPSIVKDAVHVQLGPNPPPIHRLANSPKNDVLIPKKNKDTIVPTMLTIMTGFRPSMSLA